MNLTKDAVLEIGCEELPSSYIRPAMDQMVAAAKASLKDHRIAFQRLHTYYTPRRLALFFKDLPEMQQDDSKEVTGPLVSVAFDAHGLPTRAGEGFAKAQGVSAASLKRKMTPKGEVVVALKKGGGRLTSEILAEVFPEVIRKIRFPKVQRWGNGDFLFARPIRWICAVYSRTVIPFEIAGLYSSRETWGLRSLKQGPLDVVEAGDYLEVLRQGGVIADPDERKALLWNKVQAVASEKGWEVVSDPDLLDDVNNLVEAPDVILGFFDPRYLELPDEVIVTAMREHQKYFAARIGGRLAPGFIGTINGTPKDKRVVVRANEGVLKARLEDAKFFVSEDLKLPLGTWAQKLSGITWLQGMGTLADKSQRLAKAVRKLAPHFHLGKEALKAVEEAALLCKADLATNIIREKEFNSLQGIMGGLYAQKQGKPEAGEAIRTHYYPRFAGDQLPPPGPAALLSVADKLDTLVGCFKARLIPTGSQDPFALRRQALGVLLILIENKVTASLEDLVKASQSVYKGKPKAKETQEILDFLKTRLQNVLESRDLSYDVVNAVLAAGAPTLTDLIEKAGVVQRFKSDKEFQDLATAAGRVLRILPEKRIPTKLSGALLKEHEEKNLHNAVEEVGRAVQMALEKRDYVDLRLNLQGLVKPIHAFFEKILVMDKNAKVKTNRLVLLQQTAGLLLALCDFRKLVYAAEGTEKKTP